MDDMTIYTQHYLDVVCVPQAVHAIVPEADALRTLPLRLVILSSWNISVAV